MCNILIASDSILKYHAALYEGIIQELSPYSTGNWVCIGYQTQMKSTPKKRNVHCQHENFALGFGFFGFFFSLLNVHRDLPVSFVYSLDYWGTFCAGVFLMPFFRSCCLDWNPLSANANMVYQRLNNFGHPDPPIVALGVQANARTQREWFCAAVEYRLYTTLSNYNH